MSLDPITEKIAHFIGAFEMIEEQARLRAEYDHFRAAKKLEADSEAAKMAKVSFNSNYNLKDVDPKLKYKVAPAKVVHKPDADERIVENDAAVAVIAHAAAPVAAAALPDPDAGDTFTQNFTLNPPSSVASVTIQWNDLDDNDTFGQPPSGTMEPVAHLIETLELIADLVASTGPIQLSNLGDATDWFAVVAHVHATALALHDAANGNMQVSITLGAATVGTIVNGIAVAQAPDFDDLLPAHMQEALAEKTAAAAEPPDPFAAIDRDESPFKVEDGHQVIAGANSTINSVAITSSWLDAPVILVGGDTLKYDAISQTNVLIDHDTPSEARAASATLGQASEANNIASISYQHDPQHASSPASGTGKGAPDNYVVVRIEGDLIQTNEIEQVNFTTDFDQAHVTQLGSATYLSFGENDVSNVVDLAQIGFSYDFIVVGGDLVEVNLLNQVNLMLDSDSVAPAPEPTAPVVRVDSATPVVTVTDTAPVVRVDTAQPVVSAGAETGIAVAGTAETQDDIIGIELAPATPPTDALADPAPTPQPPPPPISTGDNLLHNEATITHVGIDTEAAVSEAFAEVLDDLGEGGETLEDKVLNDQVFDGVELLRVLYIDGDFVTVNAVDQINVLGDADQVHLAQDNFAKALQHQIELVTGSNIAANFAAVQDNGLDSTVMTRGDTYSDALIHQASLIDEAPAPPGQSISALASEAVAFLADDLLENDLAETITGTTDTMIADVFNQSDIMQTMLA